ncbi:MAG: tetraacyldisaccharide 4'-kinase [Puniceicoccales bacterium]
MEDFDDDYRPTLSERLEHFEQFTVDVIYGRRQGWRESLWGGVLSGFSVLFQGIVRTRYFFYRHRILRDQPLGCLVVVVGNLTVGGTGKTPVVEKFAKSLQERGRKVAILSRGYGSKPEPKYKKFWRWMTHREAPPPKIVSDGQQVLLNASEAGDEPHMLARNLPGVVVLVDKNRVKAGEYAIKRFQCDTLLLDDGFQYLPLRGSLNLLLVDKTNPFGNGSMLPRGILREPIRNLQRASYVFLTKSDGERDAELESLIRRHKPDAEMIECSHKPQFIQEVFGNQKRTLESLRGQRVAVFSGIAVPESFEGFVQALGAEIVYKQRFMDHHRFSKGEMEHYFHQALARDVSLVLTTEKDAVRLQPDWVPDSVELFFLRLEVEIISGVKDFDEAVSRICFPKRDMRATRSAFLSTGKTTHS